MKLTDYISERQIVLEIRARKKRDILRELLEVLIKQKKISTRTRDKILAALLAREKLGSTAIGQDVAIPHARCELIKKPLIVVGLSPSGLDFDSLDGELVYVIFLILSPKNSEGVHLKILATISKILRDKYFLSRLKKTRKARKIKELIKAQEQRL